ncbi:sensor histidine kinase [Soonwooa buanensis]|uniref:sensor histidine kinase n=1 Tax=Soonwooa buanensis TaxID=619805 RepID=UPI001FE4183C|nr:histidine kinase [Soonwooa buanensis]
MIWITGSGNYAPGTGLGFYFFDNIYYSSTTIFISSVFSLINKFMKVEEERLQLVSEKKHAEIQALKTQINPHFIFNSLNNIYSLVYQKSDKALPAIEELSELLRYSTKDLQQDFIPLKREVGYIESLIALEKLRIRNPEKIIFEKNIQNENLQISPMLLVPFVENAFKHGDFNEHEMKIDLKEENNILNFRIENQKRQGSKDHASGIGITNVKKRLELIYPKKHELNISDKEIFFVVELKIEL